MCLRQLCVGRNIFSVCPLFSLCPQKLCHFWHAKCSKIAAGSAAPRFFHCHRESASESSQDLWGCSEHAEPLQYHQTMCYRAAESSSYPAPLTPLSDPAIPISKAATLCRTELACQNKLSLWFPTIQNKSSSKPCFVKRSVEVNENSIKASVAGLYCPSLGALASFKRCP